MNEEYYQMYLDELKEIKPCTDREREQLLSRAGADEGAKARLVEGHLVFALALAKDYRDKGLPMSDLVQEANLALAVAAKEYREGDFLFFVKEKITASLQEAVKKQHQEEEAGQAIAARVNVLQEVSRVMAEELGREATVEELARRMQMPSEEIRDMMKMAVNALNFSDGFHA